MFTLGLSKLFVDHKSYGAYQNQDCIIIQFLRSTHQTMEPSQHTLRLFLKKMKKISKMK